ncbi:MAG TPA: hypothetical protein VIO32_08330, partial [Candidatus Baltobacteraceae bacterium]
MRETAASGVIAPLLRALRTPAARAIMVVLLLASIPLYVLQYTLIPKTGDLGVTFDANFYAVSVNGWAAKAAAVQADSGAWKAGVRAGDRLSIPVDQREKATYPHADDRVRFIDRRGSVTRSVLVTATPKRIQFDLAAGIRAGVVLCLLVFALLVIARAWNTEHGPIIAAILAANVANAALDAIPWISRPDSAVALTAAATWLNQPLGALDILLAVVLCAQLLGRPSRAMHWLTTCAVVSCALWVTVSFALSVPPIYVRFSPLTTMVSCVSTFAPMLVAPAAVLCAFVQARGKQRARLAWIFWGFFPYYCAVALVNIDLLWFVAPTLFNDSTFKIVARTLELSLPVSLFYGLLLRRTVDIGFVVNRVAVYGVISLAVLSVFVLLEYVAGQFIEAHGAASWAIQLGIAMVIGLSARYVHGTVDRFIDRVFFAKRHADEMALKRFAQEAEAFTNSGALLDRALDAVNTHSETAGAAIYLCGQRNAELVCGAAFPPAIDIDDPLLVALRRWNEPVDTHDVKTAFPDGMVFPMSARGKLIGALACRTKRDATAFAPDEREPLAEVAHATARALEALGTESGASNGALAQTIFAMQAMMLEIRDALVTPRLADAET